jgi:methyl-accepting chemotaxis protein
MSLRSKLRTLTFITIAGLCVLFSILLHNERNQLLSDRQDKVRNLVEVATATVSHFEKQAVEGKLDVQTAQKVAHDTLRDVRYNGIDYFWIHDLNDVMIMHPIKPELEGTNLSQNKDSNGKFLFVEMNKLVKSDRSGFVDYVWPKPGFKDAVPKISFVKSTDVWHWVIGSGIYLDDVDALFWQNVLKFLAWGLLIGGFISASLMLVGRNVLRTIGGDPRDVLQVTHRITVGDLTNKVICAPGDSGSVLAGIKEMQISLHNMIEEIRQRAGQLIDTATSLSIASKQITQGSHAQSEAAASTAAAIEEMTVSITSVSDNTNEVRILSEQSLAKTREGNQSTGEMIKEVKQIEDTVNNIASSVNQFITSARTISSMTQQVKDIAEQTNLLALNAAIEAARAGEQGRGFAVVADEVRKLAEKSGQSAGEIDRITQSLEQQSTLVEKSVQDGLRSLQTTQKHVDEVSAVLIEASSAVEKSSAGVHDIASSVSEQSLASNEIARNVESIAQMAEENHAAVSQSERGIVSLNELASDLQLLVSKFKV